jgi:hypothetical protein
VSERLIAELAEVERALLRLSGSWAGVSAAYLTTAAGAAWLQEMSAAADVLRSRLGPGPLPAMRASAPPEASGLRASIEQIISDVELKAAMEETRRPGDLTIPNVQRRIVARLRAALAATPDARPDPRAEAFEDAASAVDHMELPQGGNRCEERVVVAAVKLLRSLAALPASPQATTPAPSHDAKE